MVIVVDNITTEVYIKKDKEIYTEKKNIKNWVAVRPDLATIKGLEAPRICNNLEVKVKIENGEIHTLDIGGWYIKPPK